MKNRKRKKKRGLAVHEETGKGLLDTELCVEDDESEADGEGIVAGAALEKLADGGEGGFMCIVVGSKIRAGPWSGRRVSSERGHGMQSNLDQILSYKVEASGKATRCT
jgi:hypothetical protein